MTELINKDVTIDYDGNTDTGPGYLLLKIENGMIQVKDLNSLHTVWLSIARIISIRPR